MVKFDKEKLIQTFSERYNYSIDDAKHNIDMYKFENINDLLQLSLDLWLDNGEVSDFNVNGITLEQIMKKENSNFIEALFSMSMLLNDPSMAKQYEDFNFYKE